MKRISLLFPILLMIVFLASCSVDASGPAVNIVFYSDGEIYSEDTVASGKTAAPAAAPSELPAGKIRFLFWSLESDEDTAAPFDFTTPISSDTTFYAIWADYAISYKNGNDVIHTDYAVKGKAVSAPGIQVSAPEGKEFSHWSLFENGNEYTFGNPVTSSITLHAVFKDKTFTVRFYDGISDAERTVAYGGIVAKPVDPVMSGRIFKWWSTTQNGPEYDFSTAITSDLTLFAVWDVVTYTVVFDDGTDQITQSVVAGERVKALADPAAEGKTFRYWSTSANGSPYDFSAAVNAGFTLYAVWEYEEYAIGFYSEGELYSSETVKHGDVIPQPSAPSITGKVFSHWSTAENGSTAFDFNSTADRDLKLYAVFKDVEFTVTFNDGSGMHSEKVVYGKTAEEPSEPEAEGKRFLYWSRQQEGEIPYDFTEPVLSSFTLYAVYEDIELTVTFIVGDSTREETVVYGEKAHDSYPDVPADKVFRHWSETMDGAAFDFNTPIYEDLVLYAVLEDKMVAVTFDDGTSISTIEVKYGTSASAPDNPVKDGFTFLWWSRTEGGEAFSFSEAIYENTTLYAVWKDLKIHVTFMNGSDVYLVQDIDRGTAPTMPDNPSTHPADAGEYMFWSLEPGKQGAYDFTSIPEDDITLHAVWMPVDIVINVKGTEVELIEGYHAEGNIQLPYGITVIAGRAFDSTIRTGLSSTFEPKITSIEIPSSVREIGTYAFFSCENLEKITLNEGLETINFNALAGTGIRSIRLPGSLKRVLDHACGGMDSLTSAYLSEGITKLEYQAFAGCDNLYRVSVPASVTYMEPDAFYHCYKLGCVEYAEGTEVIDKFYFFRNFDIEKIIIPSSVKSIASNVFSGCDKVIFQTDMAPSAFTAIEGFPWGAKDTSEIFYVGD